MKTSARVQTCGKLYLAGEYAVLTTGQPSIIKAIPIYMMGEIQAAPAYRTSCASPPAKKAAHESNRIMHSLPLFCYDDFTSCRQAVWRRCST